MNLKKTILIAIAVLVIIKILLSLYFNFIYFPNNPTVYKKYVASKNSKSNEGLQIKPPVGGCQELCAWGREEKIECKNYSKDYDVCSVKCYGYVSRSCQQDIFTGLKKLLMR